MASDAMIITDAYNDGDDDCIMMVKWWLVTMSDDVDWRWLIIDDVK